jgi:hypothetical protein
MWALRARGITMQARGLRTAGGNTLGIVGSRPGPGKRCGSSPRKKSPVEPGFFSGHADAQGVTSTWVVASRVVTVPPLFALTVSRNV